MANCGPGPELHRIHGDLLLSEQETPRRAISYTGQSKRPGQRRPYVRG